MASFLKPNQKTTSWYLVKFSFLILFFIFLVGWYSLPSSNKNDNNTPLQSSITPLSFSQEMEHISSNNFVQPSIWFNNFDMVQSSNSSNKTEPTVENDDTCDVSLFTPNRTFAQLCAYVRNPNNSDCNSNIYLQFLFCGLQYNYLAWIFYIFALVYLLFLFYLLGDTADGFFSPALIKISDYLRLSPNVAGVTLLALGNGSPDLSSIIIGVVRGNEGIGFGSPAGGGLFVTSFVYGCVCLLATFRLARRPYIRDVCFYLLAVCFALFLVVRRKVYIWESLFMVFGYVLYVIVVIAGRFVNQRFVKKFFKKRQVKKLQAEKEAKLAANASSSGVLQKSDKYETEIYAKDALSEGENLGKELKESDIEGSDSDSDTDDMAIAAASGWKIQPSFFDDMKSAASPHSNSLMEETPVITEKTSSRTTYAPQPSYMNLTKEQMAKRYESAVYIPRIGIIAKPRQEPKDEKEAFVYRDYFHGDQADNQVGHLVVKKLNSTEAAPVFEDEDETQLNTWGKFLLLVKYILRNIGWSERKWYQKISFIVFEGICNAFRVLTIPRADPEEWNKFTQACVPIFSPIPIVFAIGLALNRYDFVIYLIGGVFPVIAIPIGIGFILSIIILATTSRKKPPIYFPIFVIYAFFMSIVWIYIFASHLVSLIEAVGFSLSIPPSLLALTFLAWGNSAGDLIADISVARSGFPAMAVGGIFGAPILNLLFGIGFSFTLKILIPSNDPFSNRYCVAFKSDPQVAILFIGCIITLLMSLLFVPICCKFRPIKCFGVLLILSYVVALIIAIVVSLWTDLGNVIFRHVHLTPGQGNCNVFI